MRIAHERNGFTLAELIVVVAVIACLLAIAMPVIGRVRGNEGLQTSMGNLTTLGMAHVLYALDWDGRQVTWAVDDLAFYGSVANYNFEHDCNSYSDPGCHPHIVWGWGWIGGLYAYQSTNTGHSTWAFEPINFTGGASYFGHFRFPNVNPFHDYVGGRVYDPTFFAPNDTIPFEAAAPSFEVPAEYDKFANPPFWISYCMSPAAMFSPGVMRANADGGWQDPWSIDDGFTSPGLFQARHPGLKTLMIEHYWIQDRPSECNPSFDRFGSVFDCEPWFFNHGVESQPVALFYDGQVRLLPNTEVLAGDKQVLRQTRGQDGLWHRGTPFGANGYLIDVGFDGVPLSHHILTTDGILGRDTLGATPGKPADAPGRRSWRANLIRRRPAPDPQGASIHLIGEDVP